MATQDERLTRVEVKMRSHDELINLAYDILQHHEERMHRMDELIEQQKERLEEARRDANYSQKLWVHCARKYGWLDDDDFATGQ